jgi:hypothetical protein
MEQSYQKESSQQYPYPDTESFHGAKGDRRSLFDRTEHTAPTYLTIEQRAIFVQR